MINGINSNSTYLQPIQRTHNKTEVPEFTNKVSDTTSNTSVRDNLLAFISHSTETEADKKLDNFKSSYPPVAIINLKQILESPNESELTGRIVRLSDRFNTEAASYHRQEQDLISQGEANGQSSKEILKNIFQLRDNQSELFKLGTRWEGEGFSDPNSYSKLVKLTPNYVNTYA